MAGDSSGITVDSQFKLYPERKNASESWGTFNAVNIEATQATLIPDGTTSTPDKWEYAFARPVHIPVPRHGELRVRISEKLDQTVAKEVLASELFLGTDHDEVVFVDVVDDVNRGKIAVFRISMLRYGLKQVTLNRDAPARSSKKISAVLRSVGHWYFHLTHEPLSSTLGVSVEFHLLKQDYVDGTNRPSWIPDRAKPDMNVKNVIQITGNSNDKFGMTIVNSTAANLYPYLYYFDMKSLEIHDWPISADGKDKVDPPLLSKSRLAVGYGSSIAPRFVFNAVKEDEPGFFKLILTTSPTSLDLRIAPSPFKFQIARGGPVPDVTPQWGVIVVKVMQSPAKKKDQLQ